MINTSGYYRKREDPGDGNLIAEMKFAWGYYFQDLKDYERLWLLSRVAWSLYMSDPGPDNVRDGVADAAERSKYELSNSEKLKLIEDLLHQIVGDRHD